MALVKIEKELKFLREEFLREAKVIDVDRGYVSVSCFNLRMKPEVLKAAAKVIAEEFKADKVDTVHGIPHSGNYLAAAVAMELDGQVRLHTSRKDQNIPTSWKDVYREEVRSFTTSTGGVDVFSGINLSFVKKGDQVLLVDDVVKVVGFAVLFDKVFQGGLETVAELGVKVFSCVRVKELGENDRVVLLE